MVNKVHRVQKNDFFQKSSWTTWNAPTNMLLARFELVVARFELVVARFGPPKIPKCLENGLFCNQKWVKNVSKMCFSKDTFWTIWGAQKSGMSPF